MSHRLLSAARAACSFLPIWLTVPSWRKGKKIRKELRHARPRAKQHIWIHIILAAKEPPTYLMPPCKLTARNEKMGRLFLVTSTQSTSSISTVATSTWWDLQSKNMLYGMHMTLGASSRHALRWWNRRQNLCTNTGATNLTRTNATLQISACLCSCARESPLPWMLKPPQNDVPKSIPETLQ